MVGVIKRQVVAREVTDNASFLFGIFAVVVIYKLPENLFKSHIVRHRLCWIRQIHLGLEKRCFGYRLQPTWLARSVQLVAVADTSPSNQTASKVMPAVSWQSRALEWNLIAQRTATSGHSI